MSLVQQPPSNIPQTVWEKMPENVKQIYLEQQRVAEQAARDQARQQSRMENWKSVTVTGQVLGATQWTSERAQQIVNVAPISAIRESDIIRQNEPLGVAQHSAAGFVGAFESIFRPEVPTVGGAVSENVINRVLPQPKIEGYNVKTDYYQQQIGKLGPGYAVGSLFGTAVLTYAVGKGESWLLGKGEEYAMSAHGKLPKEEQLWRNAQVPYESREASRIFQQAELKSLNMEWTEEFGFKTGEFGGASNWAKSTLISPATKGSGYSPWTFDFIQSQETLPSVKPFAPLFEDYFSEAILPMSLKEKTLIGLSYAPALFSIPKTSQFIITPQTAREDFIFGGTKQGFSSIQGLKQFQRQDLFKISLPKTESFSDIWQFPKAPTKQDVYSMQSPFSISEITSISVQKQFQFQKQAQPLISLLKFATPEPFNPFYPEQQRRKEGKKKSKKKKMKGGWFNRLWPSAYDPEQLLSKKGTFPLGIIKDGSFMPSVKWIPKNAFPDLYKKRRSKKRGLFSFGF